MLGIAGAAHAQETSSDPTNPSDTAQAAPTAEAEAKLEEAEESGAVVESVEALDWTGSWRSFWRGGQALLTLEQTEDEITGTYQPGDGKLVGTLEGVIIKGAWIQPGGEGNFEFALAPDGESFVGRFGNGEYWNGERLDDARMSATVFGSATPQATMGSLMAVANAAADGDSVAELAIRRQLIFEDGETELRARNERISNFLRLIDLSTFRVNAAPLSGEAGRATFEIGPDGTDWTFPLEFIETKPEQWDLAVPPLETLEGWNADALKAIGVETFDELAESRKFSPRQAMRDFVQGAANWDDGGEEQVLATLDLSEIPEKLRAIDGPLAAENIRQIIDRLGTPVWQELPDDPNRRQPYVLYEHALGEIKIDRFKLTNEDGTETVKWLFPASTLAAAPVIYEAMQNLPLAEGVEASEPMTRAFKLRAKLKEISPRLVKRPFLLENWQWIAVAGTLVIMFVLSWIITRVLRSVSLGMLRLRGAAPETQTALSRAFGWPMRSLAAGWVLTMLLREIGLRQDVSAIGNGVAAVLLLVGGTFFVYYVVHAITVWLATSSANTDTNIDDIAVALGGGLAKIAVIVGGVILAADVLGLPYEGVIAGLGVGGLAFAIAAKDAVSNFIGAGILASDRPFKTGDRIEAGGLEGIVEEVGLRSTRLRTADGGIVVVPNATLSDGQVNNFGRPRPVDRQLIDLKIGLAVDTPRGKLDAFVERLREVFAAQPAAKPGVTVALTEIGPSSLDITVSGAFDAESDIVTARHKLLGDIVDLAAEMGVELASSTSKVHFIGEPVRSPMSFGSVAQKAASV